MPANDTNTFVKLVVHHKTISDFYKYRLISFLKYLFMQYNNPFYTNNLFACRSTACSIYPIQFACICLYKGIEYMERYE